MVEVAVAGADDEGRDLVEGVDQRRPLGVARVAHGDTGPVGQFGQLDTVAARVASPALLPRQGGSWVVGTPFSGCCMDVFLSGCGPLSQGDGAGFVGLCDIRSGRAARASALAYAADSEHDSPTCAVLIRSLWVTTPGRSPGETRARRGTTAVAARSYADTAREDPCLDPLTSVRRAAAGALVSVWQLRRGPCRPRRNWSTSRPNSPPSGTPPATTRSPGYPTAGPSTSGRHAAHRRGRATPHRGRPRRRRLQTGQRRFGHSAGDQVLVTSPAGWPPSPGTTWWPGSAATSSPACSPVGDGRR